LFHLPANKKGIAAETTIPLMYWNFKKSFPKKHYNQNHAEFTLFNIFLTALSERLNSRANAL